MSARLWSERNRSYARSSATSSACFAGDAKAAGMRASVIETSHPQFAHGGPEGLRECGMPGERPEVAAFEREIEEQAHHQRRAELFLGRIDAALDEKRRAHAERDVEWRHEPQIHPVGALEHDPLAERSANGMRGYKDPLRARGMRATQRR